MGESYKPNRQGNQNGVDRQGTPWVGFDYDSLDDANLQGNSSWKKFAEAMVHMATGIAVDMLKAVLNHRPEQVRAFILHVCNKATDRDIGTALGVDHKTAKRWYEEVIATIRLASPLGSNTGQPGKQKCKKQSPKGPAFEGP